MCRSRFGAHPGATPNPWLPVRRCGRGPQCFALGRCFAGAHPAVAARSGNGNAMCNAAGVGAVLAPRLPPCGWCFAGARCARYTGFNGSARET